MKTLFGSLIVEAVFPAISRFKSEFCLSTAVSVRLDVGDQGGSHGTSAESLP